MDRKLITTGLVNPFTLRDMASAKEAVVGEDSLIRIDELVLRFDVFGEALPPGTSVKVWLSSSGFIYCDSEESLTALAELRRQDELEHAASRRLMLNEVRSGDERFNASLALPFRWSAGIKDVLSGLSEKSMGDGRGKRTVQHIRVLEDLDSGRITRKSGDMLCTTEAGSNGKQWSSNPEAIAYDGDGRAYQPRITCKQCLRIASRWNKSGA